MFVARKVNTEHKDLIHDVAFDFYGTRMATCSSDQTVRIWEMNKVTKDWNCSSSWKAHSGSVWKVTWATPEYGQVIATCSFDRTATVWEEVGISNYHWVKKATLVDSRKSVSDVKFAPRHLGLVLATCSADGSVRIYEAPDVMNLTQWSLQYEIPVKIACSCISWNPTYPGHFPPMIAVGSDDATLQEAKVMIYEYDENSRRWNQVESLQDVTRPVNDICFAPNMGRSHHVLAIASKDLRIVLLEPQPVIGDITGSTKIVPKTVAHCFDHNATVWRVAWNVTGTVLASSGDDGYVRLWKGNFSGTWECVTVLRGDGTQLPAKATSTAGASKLVETFGNFKFMNFGAAAAVNNVV